MASNTDREEKMEAALNAERDCLVPFPDPIKVELLTQAGTMRITVRPDQIVWSAVADALGCKMRLLKQIMFGTEPVLQGESFNSIGIDDAGRISVDYSLAVSSFISPLVYPSHFWLVAHSY